MGVIERDIDVLPKNEANYAPLMPIGFLERPAFIHPHRKSVVHGSCQYTCQQTYHRCRRLAVKKLGPAGPLLCKGVQSRRRSLKYKKD